LLVWVDFIDIWDSFDQARQWPGSIERENRIVNDKDQVINDDLFLSSPGYNR
jgi:hypothetical protein